jgi:5-formyltetrahydrofolate cyclo-ligase
VLAVQQHHLAVGAAAGPDLVEQLAVQHLGDDDHSSRVSRIVDADPLGDDGDDTGRPLGRALRHLSRLSSTGQGSRGRHRRAGAVEDGGIVDIASADQVADRQLGVADDRLERPGPRREADAAALVGELGADGHGGTVHVSGHVVVARVRHHEQEHQGADGQRDEEQPTEHQPQPSSQAHVLTVLSPYFASAEWASLLRHRADWDDATMDGRGTSKREQKAALRAAMPAARRAEASSSLTAAVLTLPEVMTARIVAVYVSIGTEPPTAELLDVLRSRNARVLVPVLREDLDLDWAIYENREQMSPGPRGLWAPEGPRLGLDAIGDADVVLVPALAVGADGARLGRGGGSYDRALARVPAGRPRAALLYDGELLPGVPAEPHDERVTGVVTPSGARHLVDGGR